MISACSQNNKSVKFNSNNQNIAASINDTLISLQELDNTVQQELYDELNRIYFIRKVALDYLITEKILYIESRKVGLSVDKYLDKYCKNNTSDLKIAQFIKQNKLEKGIIDVKRALKYVDIQTLEGKELLIKEYQKYLKKIFVDSLKNKYKIQYNLAPPHSPNFSLENISLHYRGNLQSNVTLVIISDFECDMCKEAYPTYKELYNKYKDKVRFASSYFSSYISLSGIACESAGRQNKYWEMYDSIFSKKNIPDSIGIFRIAKNIKLNMELFKNDFADKLLINSIEDNFKRIHAKGIYATPTIVINNKAILNSKSFDEIEKKLITEIEKK